MVIGTVGMLPMWDKVDAEVMRATLKKVMSNWDWPTTWGWDYPMVAMCATRLNEPEIALEALLKDVQKNTYLKKRTQLPKPTFAYLFAWQWRFPENHCADVCRMGRLYG